MSKVHSDKNAQGQAYLSLAKMEQTSTSEDTNLTGLFTFESCPKEASFEICENMLCTIVLPYSLPLP